MTLEEVFFIKSTHFLKWLAKKRLVPLITMIFIGGFFIGKIPQAKAADTDIIINEVMANPSDEDFDEFVELFNKSDTETIDISGWKLIDGDGLDSIVPWSNLMHGKLDDPDIVIETTLIPPQTYAVILDTDYIRGEQPYDFPEGTIIFTVGNTALGNGLSATDDPVIIYNAEGANIANIVDTYGTPIISDNWNECDDNALDEIPFNPGNGISVEKTNIDLGDTEANWLKSFNSTGSSPGKSNNDPPFAMAGNDIEIILGERIELDGSGSFDPEGSKLTYYWDFGDGNYKSDQVVSHIYSSAGTFTVTLSVKDSEGVETTDSLIVKITTPIVYSDQIIINELFPNPSGSDSQEWIEIFNQGNSAVDLSGWQIDDREEGSNAYTIPFGTLIDPGQYLVFYHTETNIALNNEGDAVRLIHPDGNVASQINYNETAKDNLSYARYNNEWLWTDTLTPGMPNIITMADKKSKEEESDTKEGEDNESNVREITIKEVRQQEKNTKVKTKGIVTAMPDVLGSEIFYIQDKSAGIQIYFSKKEFPELKLGNQVEVIGKVSESEEEKKINIENKEDIKILAHKEPLVPKIIKTKEVDENYEGQLITVKGKVTKTSGNTFYIDDGSGEIKIYIKESTNIKKPEMKKGDWVTVAGIVSQTSSGYRILPRYQEDIKINGLVNKNSNRQLVAAGSNLKVLILISSGLFILFKLTMAFFQNKKPILKKIGSAFLKLNLMRSLFD